MIGSCGHEIDPVFYLSGQATYNVKDHARDCKRVVSVITTCKSCRSNYDAFGLILKDKKAEQKWLRGEK